MEWNRGSALIETLVAAVILVSGLVAVASIFSVTTGVSIRNRQRTTATLLLYDKMEQLRTTGSPAGGSLDPLNPMAGFMEYVRIDSDGTVVSATTDSGSAYLRLWQVQDVGNPAITIAVFAGIGAVTPLELVRGSGPR
jgi:Tfp pilus assembly protein PilV